jgi:hypothetical protein
MSTADAQRAKVAGQPERQAPAPTAITVTHGRGAPAELAAVIAVLLRAPASAPMQAASVASTSLWAAGSRRAPALPHPGSHSWRASALPL